MSITKTSQLMKCREINAVYCGSPANHVTALRETQTALCFIPIADGTNHNQTYSSCLVSEHRLYDRQTSKITTRITVLNLGSATRVSIPFCLLPTSVLSRCYQNMGWCSRCRVTCLRVRCAGFLHFLISFRRSQLFVSAEIIEAADGLKHW